MSAIHELPTDYRENLRYVLTEGRRLLWLNVAALLPMLVAIVAMAGWWEVAAPLRAASADTSLSIPWWLGIAAMYLIVLPLHELFHGLAITLVGHRARYGMKLDKGVLYATADQALFRRDEYIFVALTPLVAITLLGMGLMLLAPEELVYYTAIGVVLNAGGAVGDLWASVVVLRYSRSALVRDEEDGFRVYTASQPQAHDGSATQKIEPPSSGDSKPT
jgi:hypothetical protein